jgi:hypothetical protein
LNAYVFISYSRSDVAIVSPIVRLLRTAIAGIPSVSGNQWELVFQDVNNIEPGRKWKKTIDDAIAAAERVFVFWCTHSAKSDQVRREYELGLKLSKVLVPVLLDDTPLPDSLSCINGVDLRELRIHEMPIELDQVAKGEHAGPAEVVIHQFAPFLDTNADEMLAGLLSFWMDRYR